MWYPKNKLFSTERFDSTNTGEYLYTSFSGQNTIGGNVSLRNIATGSNVIVPPGHPWPAMSWDLSSNFSYLWSSNSGNWSLISGSTVAQNQVFGTIGITGNSRIRRLVDFSFDTGIVIEASLYLPRLTGLTSGTYNNYYGISIHDNQSSKTYEAIRVVNNPNPGFVLGYNTSYESFVPAPNLTTRPVSFRYGIRNDTGHFITEDGFSVMLTGITRNAVAFSTGASTGQINIGSLSSIFTGSNTDTRARLDVGKLYYKTPVYDIAGDFIADTLYSTGALTLTTPELVFQKSLNQIEGLTVKLAGTPATTTGETKVSLYVYNGFTWQILGSGVYTSADAGQIKQFRPTAYGLYGDNRDKVRCEITQFSTDGLKPSPPVDYITITVSEADKDGWIKVTPEVGSSNGQYNALLSINPNYEGHKKLKTKALNSETILVNFTGESLTHTELSTNLLFSGHYLSTGDVPLLTGIYGDPVQNWRLLKRYNTNIIENIFTGNYGFVSENRHYKNRYIGSEGQLLATPGYTYLFDTGNFSGASTGSIGYSLERYIATNRNTTSPRKYYTNQIQFNTLSGKSNNYIAQYYQGAEGYGFVTPIITGIYNTEYTHLVIESIVQVNEGYLYVGISGETNTTVTKHNSVGYSQYAYGNLQRVRSIFPISYTASPSEPDPTGDVAQAQIVFFGGGENVSSYNGESSFSVADVKLYRAKIAPSYLDGIDSIMDQPDTTVSVLFKSDGHAATGNSLIKLTTASDPEIIDIGISPEGFPRFIINNGGSGLQYVTGCNSIQSNRWHHLLYDYTFSDDGNEHYSVWLDGNLQFGHFLAYPVFPDVVKMSVGTDFLGAIQEVKYYPSRKHPLEHTTLESKVRPLKFRSEYQIPITNSVVYYSFDKGGLLDLSENEYNLTSPDLSGSHQWSHTNAEGVFGECVSLLGSKGYLVSFNTLDYNWSQANINFYIAAGQNSTSNNPNVWKLGDLSFSLLSGKYAKLSYTGNISYTGTTDLTNPLGWRWYLINLNIVNNNLLVTGYCGTGEIGRDAVTIDMTGSRPANNIYINGYVEFGHRTNDPTDVGDIYLDDFVVYNGLADSIYQLDTNTGKAKPSETITFGGRTIDSNNVLHLGVYDKQFTVPPQVSFAATGYSNLINVTIPNVDTFRVRPFNYIGIRDIAIDLKSRDRLEETRSKLCKTNSPIRIGNIAPKESVNLAYITMEDLSVENNLSFLDGSDSNIENYVNALSSYNGLSVPTNNTGNVVYHSYTGQVNTDDILITNQSLVRKDTNFVSPLFYKHIIGDNRYYVYSLAATTSSNADLVLVRSSIKLIDQNGDIIDIENYPYDVRISKYRVDDVELPSHVYNVEILTRDKFIEGKTIFVIYDAADPLQNYNPIKGYTEVLNPEPIFKHIMPGDNTYPDTFVVEDAPFNPDLLNRKYNEGPIITVYHNTGVWYPGVHKYIRS